MRNNKLDAYASLSLAQHDVYGMDDIQGHEHYSLHKECHCERSNICAVMVQYCAV